MLSYYYKLHYSRIWVSGLHDSRDWVCTRLAACRFRAINSCSTFLGALQGSCGSPWDLQTAGAELLELLQVAETLIFRERF